MDSDIIYGIISRNSLKKYIVVNFSMLIRNFKICINLIKINFY